MYVEIYFILYYSLCKICIFCILYILYIELWTRFLYLFIPLPALPHSRVPYWAPPRHRQLPIFRLSYLRIPRHAGLSWRGGCRSTVVSPLQPQRGAPPWGDNYKERRVLQKLKKSVQKLKMSKISKYDTSE